MTHNGTGPPGRGVLDASHAVLEDAGRQAHHPKLNDIAAQRAFTGELPHGGTLPRQTSGLGSTQAQEARPRADRSIAETFNVTSLVDPDGERGVIFLQGEIDTAAANDVVAEGASLLSCVTIKRLVIDLAHVTFIDASGIGALVQVHRMTDDPGRRATLHNPSHVAAALLKLTAIDQLFERDAAA